MSLFANIAFVYSSHLSQRRNFTSSQQLLLIVMLTWKHPEQLVCLVYRCTGNKHRLLLSALFPLQH